MGYSKNALQGSGWNSLVKVLTVFATGAKILVLARLLTPYDFGLAQYVIITLGILESCMETGINTTIVQSKQSIHYFLNTAWVISILRGLLISTLMIVSGLFMQQYFHEQKLLLLMTVGSFVPFIKGFISPGVVTFYKDLRFFRDSVYRFSLIAVDAVAAIFCAFLFRSVFVFVYAMIAAALFEVIISFFFFGERPQFHTVKSRLQEIFHNAPGLNLSTILGYLIENLDNLMVGKVIGTVGLGIYSQAYSLSHKFTLQFAKSVQHGTFPVYVKIVDQRTRLRRAFWKTALTSIGFFSLISLPFLIFPGQTVFLLLGPQWQSVGEILQPLVFASIIQSFVAIATALFTATKHYTWLNLTMFVNLLLLIILVIVMGQRYGLIGCVWGVLLSRLLVLPMSLYGSWSILRE